MAQLWSEQEDWLIKCEDDSFVEVLRQAVSIILHCFDDLYQI